MMELCVHSKDCIPFDGEYVICKGYRGEMDEEKKFRFKCIVLKRYLWRDYDNRLHYVTFWMLDPEKPKISVWEKHFQLMNRNLIKNDLIFLRDTDLPKFDGTKVEFSRFDHLPRQNGMDGKQDD